MKDYHSTGLSTALVGERPDGLGMTAPSSGRRGVLCGPIDCGAWFVRPEVWTTAEARAMA